MMGWPGLWSEAKDISPLAKAPENILPVIMGKHQNVIRMANFMKFHLVNSAHFLSHFFSR